MKFLALALTIAILTGCQTVPYQGKARNVTLKPHKQGVISIPVEYRDEDRQKATQVMAKNCQPYQPEITEEGEVATGTRTNASSKQRDVANSKTKLGSLFGIPLTSGEAGGQNTATSSTTTQIKEWHISYRCDRKKKRSTQ